MSSNNENHQALKNLSIIVHSCDSYFDSWNPFFFLFFKYWNDIPFPVYLCTETLEYSHTKVKTILPGKKEWSQRLIEALNAINTKYVLLLLDDYLLYKKVDSKRIIELMNVIEETTAACLRIFPAPPPDAPLSNKKGIGIINKGARYRVSTQATIWNTEILLSLLKPDETVWQFEEFGTMRSTNIAQPFLSVEADDINKNYPYTYIFTGIIRGRWTREAINLCKKENIQLDLNYRKAKPKWDPIFQSAYKLSPILIKHFLDFIYNRLVPSFIPKLK